MGESWVDRRRAAIERLLRRPAEPSGEGSTDPLTVDWTPLVSLVARVGAIALVTGASASEATSMMLRIGLAFRVRLHVDVTYTAITVSFPGDAHNDPVTLMRTVPALDSDYARLAHLQGVVDAVSTERMTVEDATRELTHRGQRGLGYRPWVVNTAAFGQGASICALLGGAAIEALVAGVATLLIGLAARAMSRQGAPYFLAQVVGGAIPTLLTVVLMYARDHGVGVFAELSPSLVVASGMVTMLAGLGVVGAAQDALDGYFLTAAARVIDLVMRTGGLIVGVSVVLWLALAVGVPAFLSPEPLPLPPVAVQVVAAGLFALFMGIGSRLGPRGVVLAGLFGAFAWLAYRVIHPLVRFDYAVAASLAAIAVACFVWLVADRLRIPAIALITPAIAPLMPGMILYRGLYRLVTGDPAVEPGDAAGDLFLVAALTGLGLALGSSLGATIGRRLVQPQEALARVASQLSLRRGLMRRH